MGSLVVISAPSGTGKNTVVRALLKELSRATRLVTTTSRPTRPGEKDGVDYYFVSREEFERLLAEDAFVEYNEYAGNYYGTERKHLETLLADYAIVFAVLDVNGKKNLDKKHISHLSIFLIPETLEALRQRLIVRGGLSKEKIEARLEQAKKEIAVSSTYDIRVVNPEGKIGEAVANVREFLTTQGVLDNGVGV